jgi:hypothetical protein
LSLNRLATQAHQSPILMIPRKICLHIVQPTKTFMYPWAYHMIATAHCWPKWTSNPPYGHLSRSLSFHGNWFFTRILWWFQSRLGVLMTRQWIFLKWRML